MFLFGARIDVTSFTKVYCTGFFPSDYWLAASAENFTGDFVSGDIFLCNFTIISPWCSNHLHITQRIKLRAEVGMVLARVTPSRKGEGLVTTHHISSNGM